MYFKWECYKDIIIDIAIMLTIIEINCSIIELILYNISFFLLEHH